VAKKLAPFFVHLNFTKYFTDVSQGSVATLEVWWDL